MCHFRRKLLEQGLERELFERLVRAAREAGLIANGAAQLLDSSHILGAAGARDTYTLIRGGIRKLLVSGPEVLPQPPPSSIKSAAS